LVRRTNRYIEETAPFKLWKTDKIKAGGVLYNALEALRISAVLLHPVMPNKMSELLRQLGWELDGVPIWSEQARWGLLKPGTLLKPGPYLFPRIDTDKVTSLPESFKPSEKQKEALPMISFQEFQRMELRVADIVAAEKVPNTENLLKIEIKIGTESRSMIAGIARQYAPEALVGRQVVVVANLAPAKIRGIESNAMLLAAVEGDDLALVVLDRPFHSGARVH
jgi:methionyl-tRNA synthetase